MNASRQQGFTLLEVMVSIAITLLIMAVLFTGLNQAQRRYRGEQLLAEVSDGIRAAGELVFQEVSLAGNHGFATRRVGVDLVGSTTSQTMTLDDATGIFVGQRLLVDVGNVQEIVEITAVSGNNVTGVFREDHLTDAPVNSVGPFPSGILASSTATRLQMFGDLQDDGTLQFVEYRVRGSALIRSETPIGTTPQNPWNVILDDLLPNPGATPVFQYTTRTVAGTAFVTQITVTLTSETSTPDPETGSARTQTLTFSVIPRNVKAALELDSMSGGNDFLQNEPPGLPIAVASAYL